MMNPGECKFTILGRLSNKPVVKNAVNGDAFADVSIYVKRSVKKSGAREGEATYENVLDSFNIRVWKREAMEIAKREKHDYVYFSGNINTKRVENFRDSGKPMTMYNFIATGINPWISNYKPQGKDEVLVNTKTGEIKAEGAGEEVQTPF